MPSIDVLLTFTLVSFLLSITPGPSVLYIMARSVSQGPRAGVSAASGMAVGSFIYVLATVLGIAAIFQYSPMVYSLVKFAGAAYLIYLGIQYFTAESVDLSQKQGVARLSGGKILKQSVVVELTNPKTALFFLAFLPQFVDVAQGSMALQLVVLGLVYTLVTLTCDICVALLSGRLGRWLNKNPSVARLQDKFSGGLLVSLGVFIAYDSFVNDQ